MSQFTAILLLAIVAVGTTQAIPQTIRDGTSDYSYDPESHTGPNSWGSIEEDFRMCGAGKKQSPINIVKRNAKYAQHSIVEVPKLHLTKSTLTYSKTTFNWAVSCKEGTECGFTKFGNKAYQFVGIHLHSPSEHTINGKHAPLEMHMVHRAEDGSLAVVGTMFHYSKHGKENKVMEKIIRTVESHDNEVDVNLNRLTRSPNGYYVYSGSLTTPPCTEGVTWMVSRKTLRVSKAQVKRYIRSAGIATHGNSRPIQKMNGRAVTKYGFF